MTPRLLLTVAACAAVAAPAHAQTSPPAPALTPPPGEDAELYRCRSFGPDDRIKVTLAPTLDLEEVLVWAMGFTCKSVIFDSNLRNRTLRVPLSAPSEMTPPDAYRLFVAVLQANNISVVPSDRNLRLISGQPPPPPLPGQDPEADLLAAADKGVRKLSDSAYVIDRALVDTILLDPSVVTRQARLLPSTKDGNVNGFRLYLFRARSVFAKIGLQNGDIIKSINGLAMSSPDKALEMYAKVRSASNLSISILRRGQPVQMDYSIK